MSDTSYTHTGSYREPDKDASDKVWFNYVLFEMAARLGWVERMGNAAPVDEIEQLEGSRAGVTREEAEQNAEADRARGFGSAVLSPIDITKKFFYWWDEESKRGKLLGRGPDA